MPLAGSVIYVEKKSCIRCASVLQMNTSTSFSPAFTASVISQRYGRQMRCPMSLPFTNSRAVTPTFSNSSSTCAVSFMLSFVLYRISPENSVSPFLPVMLKSFEFLRNGLNSVSLPVSRRSMSHSVSISAICRPSDFSGKPAHSSSVALPKMRITDCPASSASSTVPSAVSPRV